MEKNLTINVVLNAQQAQAEAEKLYKFLTNMSGAGTSKSQTTTVGVSQKTIDDTKKLSQALLDEQKIILQSTEGWDRYSKGLQEAKLAAKALQQELKAARSATTTPYLFSPIDLKQVQLYAQAIKTTGIPETVLRSYKLTDAEIKQLISVYNQLTKAVAASNAEIVSTRVKDIRAGVIVKGQGEQLGAGYVSEQTVRDMDSLIKKYPQLQGQIQTTGINLEQYHSKFSKLVETTKNYIKFQVGWFLGAGTIFAAVGAITSAAREVVVFDQSLRDLQAVTGATSQEVNILADTAKRVSKETPLAATEVVKLGLQLMRAGLDIEATTGAMEAAAKVATISGEDLKTVADTMASVFMIWKLGAEDATRAGTVLAAALNYSKLNIEDFGTALNYVGGMAATMGISLEETAGVLASISNLGVRASTMATGWRSFVQEMAAPSAKLSKILYDLGADFDKLNVTKIEGPHKMATVLAELERVGYDTQAALSSLEKRTLAFFLAIKTVGVPALLTMEEKMSDQRAYTEGLDFAMQGLSNQVKNFRNHILLAALNIGQVLLPVMKVLVSIFTTLANVLAHSISFFTSFPGVIITITATFASLLATTRLLIAANALLVRSFMITVWQQMVGVITTFINVIKVAWNNVRFLGFALQSLWVVMARNPLGLLALAITAIVGSAFIDWLIKGQSEFEKLGSKADKLTKSGEELKKKGDELRKQYPELFQAMAEGAENAADAMTLYKKRIDEAINVPTFKAPELPDNIKEWIDKNLVPSIEKIKVFKQELDILQKQITKLVSEPIKVTTFDVISAIFQTWINMFGLLPNNIKWVKEIWTDFVNWLAKSVKTILNTLGEIPFLGGLKEAAKNVDSFMASLKALPGKVISYPKNAWTEFIEEIRKSKTPEAKKQLEEFTAQYKETKGKLDLANTDFKKIVAEGDFSKMLEQIITATKKFTSEERKGIAFENLTKMIADIASNDPDRLKAVLLGMAEAYSKAAAQFEKADKGIGKRITAGISDVLQLEKNMFKDSLQEMKLSQGEELKELEHQNNMKELSEQAFTTQIQAEIEERTWINETFYEEGITGAKDYYDEKQKLLEMSFANEIKIIQAQTERSLSEIEKQQDNLIKQEGILYTRINQIQENILNVGGTQGLNLVNLLTGGADEKDITEALGKVPELYRDIIKAQITEYGDLENELKKVGISFTDLKNKSEELTEQGLQKVTQATIKNTAAMRKLNYESQKDLATESLKNQLTILNAQKENVQLQIEANDIAGNWQTAENLKITLLNTEYAIAYKTLQVKMIETGLNYSRATEGSAQKAVLREQLDLIQEQFGLLEKLSGLQLETEPKTVAASVLRDKADYYSTIIGYEDEYRKNQLAWIEKIRQAEVAAAQNATERNAANAKAIQAIGDLNQKIFEAKTKQVASGLSEMESAFTAISNMYAEGTANHEAWAAAAKAMLIAQKALAVVNAVAAIANQGLGDPYTAFARIAAMVATMASLLSSIGESVGGTASTTSTTSATASTVLGAEAGTGSESVGKSLTILEDTYSMEYSKLTDIYESLKELNTNITGLVKGVVLYGSNFTIGNFGVNVGGYGSQGIFSDLSNIFFGGRTKEEITASGIEIGSTIISDLLSGMDVGVQAYADVHKHVSGGWFSKDSDYYYTLYEAVDGNITTLFTKVFKNLSLTLVDLAIGLGIDTQAVFDYVFEETKINLKDMTSEEINTTLSEYFSNLSDTATEALFGSLIDSYQKIDEGLYETAVRLVTDKEVILNMLEETNQAFTGTTSEAIALSESLITLAGSLSDLTDAAATYYDKFFSDTEKTTLLQGQLSDTLTAMNLTLPTTRDGYRDLIESLDLTTESGQEAYVTLLTLAEYADTYYSYLEDLAANVDSLASSAFDFAITMQSTIDDLTGSSEVMGMYWSKIVDIYNQFNTGAGTDAERIAALEEYTTLLDDWVTASEQAIEDYYTLQTDAIQAQIDNANDLIDALNDQNDAIDDQISAIQTEVDLTDKWMDVLDSVNSQILDMKTSTDSSADIFERLAVQRAELERVKALYEGATGEAKTGYASDLMTAISDYLSMAQEAYQRPSSEYQAIYDEMLGWLEDIKVDAEAGTADQTDLLAQIADLENQQTVIDAQIAAYDEKIAAYDEEIAALETQQAADIQEFKDEAAGYYQWAMDEGATLYKDQISELQQTLRDLIGDKTVGGYIQGLQDATVTELTNVQSAIYALHFLLAGSTYAEGGYVSKPTFALVGEKGPEWIIPQSKMGTNQNVKIDMALPAITINAGDKASAKAIARTTEDMIIKSLKSGRIRKVVQEVTAGR